MTGGELVAVVSMDLSKAFDVIQYPLLLSKLRAYGMDDKSCALIRNYLSSRTQRVKVGDTFSIWESVKRGLQQGSVLGPMLLVEQPRAVLFNPRVRKGLTTDSCRTSPTD